MLSTQGPKLAVSDVDGDGLEDVFVGGAKDQAGGLFLQRADGSFAPSNVPLFQRDAKYEDVGAVFFDANGDGLPDLYVVSGSNEFDDLEGNYTDRLYLNMGQGRFANNSANLPSMDFSGSCAVVGDVDGDGDLDLFIGGRLIPGRYPMAPKSRILLNDGQGKFTDATEDLLGPNAQLGMVNDAVFTDFNGDGSMDLIAVGEFMPITFLAQRDGRFVKEVPEGLESSSGWWNSIFSLDIDGDLDHVLGNFGMNSQLKASQEEPVSLYTADFDDNGDLDPILCYYLQEGNYPVFSKDDLSSQLAFLKGRFPNYENFANQTIEGILGPENMKKAALLEAHTFNTSVLRNQGNGFTLEALPLEAQFAPTYAIVPWDVDGDGDLDLLLFGNFFETRVRFGRYDANHGLLLINDGKGNFSSVGQTSSGLNVQGQVRDAKMLDGSRLLLALNNGPLIMYRTNPPIEAQ